MLRKILEAIGTGMLAVVFAFLLLVLIMATKRYLQLFFPVY